MSQRVSDVKALCNLYVEQANSNLFPNMETLVTTLSNRGYQLKNPLATDPAKPSYRVVLAPSNAPINSPNIILIEETENVGDSTKIVRAYADGAVRVEHRH